MVCASSRVAQFTADAVNHCLIDHVWSVLQVASSLYTGQIERLQVCGSCRDPWAIHVCGRVYCAFPVPSSYPNFLHALQRHQAKVRKLPPGSRDEEDIIQLAADHDEVQRAAYLLGCIVKLLTVTEGCHWDARVL